MHPLLNVAIGFFSAWISAPVGSGIFAPLIVVPELRAAWTPPGFVFAIVWNIAFILLALEYRQMSGFSKWLHFAMLHSWTPIFFGLHMYRVSVVLFGGIYILSLFLLASQARFRAIHKRPSSLPTILWVLFLVWLGYAASLNIYATSNAIQYGIADGTGPIGQAPTRIAQFLYSILTWGQHSM